MHKELEALAGIDLPSMSHFWSWVNKAFTDSYREEIEAYLGESVDHRDLEHRMRILQSRGMLC